METTNNIVRDCYIELCSIGIQMQPDTHFIDAMIYVRSASAIMQAYAECNVLAYPPPAIDDPELDTDLDCWHEEDTVLE